MPQNGEIARTEPEHSSGALMTPPPGSSPSHSDRGRRRRGHCGWIYSPPSFFIAIAAAMAVAFWLLDSGLNELFFDTDNIRLSLFPDNPDELTLRLIQTALFLVGGLLSAAFARRLVRLERRNKALQERLSAALTRALSEFLPICSYCKSIRNEDESWETVDRYISKRTATQFSHGICPDCYAKYFPEDA